MQTAVSNAAATPTGRVAGGERRLLVAGDEPGIGPLIGRLLRWSGYRAEVVQSVAEARRRLVRAPVPDLVLLDLARASDEALTFCREIAAARPRLPLVAMTSAARPEVGTQALRAGCTYVLEKPFTPEALERVLLAALRCGEDAGEREVA